MEISDVRVKLIGETEERLKAVCTVTFDDEFVVRDVKVVDGTNGLFVAMPSRKLSVHCAKCRHKNHLRAQFCNECGAKLPPGRPRPDTNGRTRLHRDIAHPITAAFRERIQTRVIEAYTAELDRSEEPGYEPVAMDDYGEDNEKDKDKDKEKGKGSEKIRPLDGSEYDEMIAELKGGSSRGNRPPHPTQPERSAPPVSARPRVDAPAGNGDRPRERDVVSQPKPPARGVTRRPVRPLDDGFGAGLSEDDSADAPPAPTAPRAPAASQEPPPRRPRRSESRKVESELTRTDASGIPDDAVNAPVATTSPAASDNASADDDDGFGAGIL